MNSENRIIVIVCSMLALFGVLFFAFIQPTADRVFTSGREVVSTSETPATVLGLIPTASKYQARASWHLEAKLPSGESVRVEDVGEPPPTSGQLIRLKILHHKSGLRSYKFLSSESGLSTD